MTSERRNECLRAIRGYIRRFVPPGEFLDDCFKLLEPLDTEVCDGLAVRQEIALLLGLTPDDKGREELTAWFAIPNIRAEIIVLQSKVEELNKLVEEAQTARAQDQQLLVHLEGFIASKGLTCPPLEPRKYKSGDRVLLNLGYKKIPAKVMYYTPRRICVQDLGEWARKRFVKSSAIEPDPNPGG